MSNPKRTSQLMRRRATSQFEFGLPFQPRIAYSFGKKYQMHFHHKKIGIIIGLACIAGLSFFGIAHAYKTKVVTVSLDDRINIGKVIREIESLSNAKCVSEFRNLSSLNRPDKIDQIKIRMMKNQGSEEGVVARAIGHVWMTGSKDSEMVMIRLLDSGHLRVTRLEVSICPPSSSFLYRNQ